MAPWPCDLPILAAVLRQYATFSRQQCLTKYLRLSGNKYTFQKNKKTIQLNLIERGCCGNTRRDRTRVEPLVTFFFFFFPSTLGSVLCRAFAGRENGERRGGLWVRIRVCVSSEARRVGLSLQEA